jgi:hypothetical protein
MHCGHFLISCAPHLSSNYTLFIHQSFVILLQKRHLVAKRGEIRREMSLNFAYKYLCSYRSGFLTYRKISRHGADGSTSPPKEIVLRIFVALKATAFSRV